ncbi:MAG: hypothetical protein GQ477_00375 [Nanohaloarchaea archaeon]|nr:hypothetical protein [Candidatus Nanohaloarchaea archaeon]
MVSYRLTKEETIKEFIDLSGKGNIKIIFPQEPNYDKVCKDAIGRIQYRDKGSFNSSNYRTVFIKALTEDGGDVLDPESYGFSGPRDIELSFIKKDDVSEIYGKIYLGTDEVPSSETLKVFIDFM